VKSHEEDGLLAELLLAELLLAELLVPELMPPRMLPLLLALLLLAVVVPYARFRREPSMLCWLCIFATARSML
jgi:hypothetical protein